MQQTMELDMCYDDTSQYLCFISLVEDIQLLTIGVNAPTLLRRMGAHNVMTGVGHRLVH
jgi:hypothetical protein